MTNTINILKRRIWPFGNPADAPQRTMIMGHSSNTPKNIAKFGIKNRELASYSENCLDLSALFGIAKDYLTAFFGTEDSPAINVLNKIVFSTSEFFTSKRDELMYKIYGSGVDSEIYNGTEYDAHLRGRDEVSEIQKEILSRGDIPDDLAENLGQKQTHGEEIVPFFGWLAKLSASVKPVISPIAAFLPQNLKSLVDSALDTGARAWWRMRMFGPSLHANFLTSAWKLAKYGTLSIVSPSAREELDKHKKELTSFARKYFNAKEGAEGTTTSSQNNDSFGLYFSMLKDRVLTHWKDARSTGEELEAKLRSEGVYEPADHVDQRKLKLDAISELTAPFCSAIGLLGTFVFEPIKLIWNFAGIETGRGLISALAASRKSAHLFNYVTRFMLPEYNAASGTEFNDLREKVQNGNANELETQIYNTKQQRRRNGVFGLLVAAGNIVEPIFHLSRNANSENRAGNFMFSLLTRFNDTGLLRFFSTRRETYGREAIIHSITQKEGKAIQNIDLSAEEISSKVRQFYKDENIAEEVSSLATPIIRAVGNMRAAASSNTNIHIEGSTRTALA